MIRPRVKTVVDVFFVCFNQRSWIAEIHTSTSTLLFELIIKGKARLEQSTVDHLDFFRDSSIFLQDRITSENYDHEFAFEKILLAPVPNYLSCLSCLVGKT